MTIVSLVLAVLGFAGAAVGLHWMIGLSFLGMCGPFLLREAGVLRWRDDFQREAVMRSGMYSLVATGLLMTIVVAMRGMGSAFGPGSSRDYPDAFPLSVVFLLLATTWGLSWLLQFWGPRVGAARILLLSVGTYTAILVFANVAHLVQGHHVDLTTRAHVVEWARTAMIWVTVWTCRRWPRATGVALLAIVGWFLSQTLVLWTKVDNVATVLVLLYFSPLTASALTLVFSRHRGVA